MKKIDLTGQTFSRLFVIEEAGRYRHKNTCLVLWKCQCKCGDTKIVSGHKLRTKHVQSCGCMEKENLIRIGAAGIHYESSGRRREYKSWLAMKERCVNKNREDYNRYGGRGITVCKRWTEPNGQGYINFLSDLGRRPEGYTLDRINNAGNYEPGNCRWASAKQQANNRGY